MLKVVDIKQPCADFPESELKHASRFPLDPFQQHAVAAIHRGENVLVTAKTGSGKTYVGEYQIHYSLAKGQRVFFTTPIKSLSNEKFRDLKNIFPSVGILTGDIKFKPDAQVVVMTTEILRNALYKQSSSTVGLGLSASINFENVGAVVFDEVHYINNRERGKVWEESLILLPPSVNLIMLSATLAAPEEFAGWIGDLKQKPCVLISTQHRVVPLTHNVIDFAEEKLVTIMDEKDNYNDGAYKGWVRAELGFMDKADKFKMLVKDARASGHEGAVGGKVTVQSFLHKMNRTINLLDSRGLLPALCFVFSRKDCERYADKVEATLIESSDSASVKHIIDFHLHRYPSVVQTRQYHHLCDLLKRGIAYHHSGLLPLLKEIVEILFAKGLIKILFCTETFAVGINMPTKTAVFLDFHKYDTEKADLRCLYTAEYLQMAGRAGRRGIDEKGTVIYLPQRKTAFPEEVRSMMKGSTQAIESRMDFHYEFLLKTIQSGSLKWVNILKDSYWYKQKMVTKAILEKELLAMEEEYAKIRATISDEDYAELDKRAQLEDAVKGTGNAARKAAQRALETWKNGHNGPRWVNGWAQMPTLKRSGLAIEKKKADVACCDKYESLIEPRLDFLKAAGFLKIGSDAENISVSDLTLRGVLATEVNEAHSLVTADIYASGLLKDAKAETILTLLAAFINEKAGSENDGLLRVSDLRVSKDVCNYLYDIDSVAAKFCKIEGTFNIPLDNYWNLSLNWVEPVWRWLHGENSATLCDDYGFYEGNLMRTILRLANIADEWISLATYCEHGEMVERMTAAKVGLLREIAITDSLYLRI
jgi:superfamily II RNA helicase